MKNQFAPAEAPVEPSTLATQQPAPPERWQLCPGLELMGQTKDSGLKQDTYMVRRADGQIIQISALLHVVLENITPDLSADAIADNVSAAYGKTLDADGLRYVIAKYLEPLGAVEAVGTAPSSQPLPRARTIMSLTLRLTVIPPAAVRVLSRIFSPLFHPVIVAIGVAAWVVLGIILIQRGDIWQSFDEILQTPLLMLAMMVVFAACAIVHELGHATATT